MTCSRYRKPRGSPSGSPCCISINSARCPPIGSFPAVRVQYSLPQLLHPPNPARQVSSSVERKTGFYDRQRNGEYPRRRRNPTNPHILRPSPHLPPHLPPPC